MLLALLLILHVWCMLTTSKVVESVHVLNTSPAQLLQLGYSNSVAAKSVGTAWVANRYAGQPAAAPSASTCFFPRCTPNHGVVLVNNHTHLWLFGPAVSSHACWIACCCCCRAAVQRSMMAERCWYNAHMPLFRLPDGCGVWCLQALPTRYTHS